MKVFKIADVGEEQCRKISGTEEHPHSFPLPKYHVISDSRLKDLCIPHGNSQIPTRTLRIPVSCSPLLYAQQQKTEKQISAKVT